MTRRILLGVTADTSLGLMDGFPQYIAEHGWEVHVVSSPGPKNRALSKNPTVNAHTLRMDRAPSPFRDMRALISWIRLLRRVQPEVISVGTPKAALLGLVAGFLTRVPRRIYTLRGLRYETTAGMRRGLFRLFERITAACAHEIVAVSDSLMRRAIYDRWVAPEKIRVLGSGSSNGVNIERFASTRAERLLAKQERWPDAPGLPVIGFIGRLHPDKGIDLLLESSISLLERGESFRLIVIGESESQEDYQRRFTDAGVSAEFTGKVQDVAPLLRLIDILCLPTQREGFPNVVLEAAAASVPTVATAATGVEDAVVHGQTGLVCGSRDPAEFAAALLSLFNDPELRDRLGAGARRRVDEEFSAEHLWQLTLQYYSGGR